MRNVLQALYLPLKLSIVVFLGFAFLLPNHYYPWGSFYLEFSAFLALVLGLGFCLMVFPTFKVPRLYLFWVLLAFVPWFQCLFGHILFLGDAAMSSFYIFGFFVALSIGYILGNSCKDDRYPVGLAFVLLFVGVVSVWISLIQWLGTYSGLWVHNIPPGGRPFGNLGQPNNYATLIFVSTFSLYFLYEKKYFSVFGLGFIGVFLVAGLALAQSRTSSLVFISLILLVLVSFLFFQGYRKSRLVFLLMSMAGFYGFGVFFEFFSEFLGLAQEAKIRSGLNNVRIEMWSSFWAAITDKPVFGYGWGQVSVAQRSVAELYPEVGMTQYSHNLFLDLMIWNGIPLGVIVFMVVAFLFTRVFSNSFSKAGFYALCVVSAILVHALLEYPHAYSYFLLLAAFFIGMGSSNATDGERGLRKGFAGVERVLERLLDSRVSISKTIATAAFVLSFFLLGTVWYEYRLIENDQRLLRFEAASIGTLKASQKAPDVFIIDQIRGFLWVARTHSFEELSESEKVLIHSVADRFPLPMPILKQARLLWYEGKKEEAVQALQTIRGLYGVDAYERVYNALVK